VSVLVTGGAGFIGSHLVERLAARDEDVVVVDTFDPFYDPAVKRRNLAPALATGRVRVIEMDAADSDGVDGALGHDEGVPDAIVHLAARAGVRPSIDRPHAYAHANVTGTAGVLELARRRGIGAIVYGSSSSVYGDAAAVPFTEADPAIAPISPYAATKRAGELLCHAHAHLHDAAILGLRFFTVVGPRQRPDLAIHAFAHRMARNQPIPLFGDGATERDYTYVGDIVDGVLAAVDHVRTGRAGFEPVNLGGSRTTRLDDLVRLLGDAMGIVPRVEWHPAQPGDVRRTFADIRRAGTLLGYRPAVGIEEGVQRFVRWFREQPAR
jgi:UDP-glucuronate 4-epimerase